MIYLYRFIIIIFLLSYFFTYSQSHKGLENKVIKKLIDDNTAYHQFILLGRAYCYDETSRETIFFEEKFIDLFNDCNLLINENTDQTTKYVKCTVFTRLLNDDDKYIKQYYSNYMNKYKREKNSSKICDRLFTDNSSLKKTYIKFINKKKNYMNKLDYNKMENEINDYLKYGYILVQIE